jgi:Zn-finger nucleic acid-binding protein
VKCPTCPDSDLAMTAREGIEIDYCPQCRGVWLDRGELDKIIERSEAAPAPRPPESERHRPGPGYREESTYRGKDGYRDGGYDYRGKKKKNLLKELLDF